MDAYVDFDGTISPNRHGILEHPPFPHAVQTILDLKAKGYTITIYTCRASEDVVGRSRSREMVAEMKEYLANHGIKYDYIQPGKPLWNVIIDDTAIGFRGCWNEVRAQLELEKIESETPSQPKTHKEIMDECMKINDELACREGRKPLNDEIVGHGV